MSGTTYSRVFNKRIGNLGHNKRIRGGNRDLSYKRIGVANDYNKRIGGNQNTCEGGHLQGYRRVLFAVFAVIYMKKLYFMF